MSEVSQLCEIALKTFSHTLTNNPLASAYLLGNLYYFLEKDTTSLVKKTIAQLKLRMTKEQINLLWETIQFKKEEYQTMSIKNKKSFFALQTAFLHDIEYFKQIENHTLIQLGQNPTFAQAVLIALIRKHLLDHQLSDPFYYKNYNAQLLKTASIEEAYLYVYPFLKDCQTLPIKDIVLLGRKEQTIATLILKNVSTSIHYFDVSEALLPYYPSLRQSIAENWGKLRCTYPFTETQNKSILEKEKKLKAQYQAFKTLQIEVRPERVPANTKLSLQSAQHWKNLLNSGICVGVFLGITAITYSIPPSFLPLYCIMLNGALGGLLIKKYKTKIRKALCYKNHRNNVPH